MDLSVSIPGDVWTVIFLHCDLPAIASVKRACKRFRSYCRDPSFMIRKLREHRIHLSNADDLASFYRTLHFYFPPRNKQITELGELPRFRVMFVKVTEMYEDFVNWKKVTHLAAIELFFPDDGKRWRLFLAEFVEECRSSVRPLNPADDLVFENTEDMLLKFIEILRIHRASIAVSLDIERDIWNIRNLLRAHIADKRTYLPVLKNIWLLPLDRIAGWFEVPNRRLGVVRRLRDDTVRKRPCSKYIQQCCDIYYELLRRECDPKTVWHPSMLRFSWQGLQITRCDMEYDRGCFGMRIFAE